MDISPAFAENNIPVVFATDKNFALYMSVAIKSLIDNSSPDNNYDILILDTGMDDKMRKMLLSLADENISIRIIDTAYILSEYGDLFYIHSGASATTYIRIFIPELLKQYKKVVYLDCDLIVLDDIAKLFNTDIKQFSIGAVPDHAFEYLLNDEDIADYRNNVLKLNDKCINAGVLIINIDSWIEKELIDRCLEIMKTGIQFRVVDQCVINYVCNGKIDYIEYGWNSMDWHCVFDDMSEEEKKKHKPCIDDPKIIHYVSGPKPWNDHKRELADIWWSYAKKLDWYADILEISLDIIYNKMSNTIESMAERTERHLSIIAEKNKRIAELEKENNV